MNIHSGMKYALSMLMFGLHFGASGPAVARAQGVAQAPSALGTADAGAGRGAEAEAAYAAGVAAFKARDYAVALRLLERAQALDPSPVLLYNLARVYEEMGQGAQAVAYFERYLATAGDVSDRAQVTTRIRVTRKMLERQRAARRGVGPGAPGVAAAGTPIAVEDGRWGSPTENAGGGWRAVGGYTSLVAAGAAVGLAGFYYDEAQTTAASASRLRGQPEARRTARDAFDRAELGMWVSVAGAAALTGLAVALLVGGGDEPGVTAVPGGVVLSW